MKKLVEAVVTVAFTVAAGGGIAAAASTTTCAGSISNTGPGSKNTVKCVDNNNNSVSCNNHVVVDNSNKQKSGSGSASSTSNTSSGSATSGNSSNSNTVSVKLGASCNPSTSKSSSGSFTVPTSATHVLGAQVTAPAGGVNAGGGAGVKSNNVLPIAGIAGSVALIGLGAGLGLRKRAHQL